MPRNPRIPIAGFIYPDFTTKEKILDYPDTVSFLRDSRYPDSGFWTLGIIIWVYIVYGHCTMTKQLPCLNAIIRHASVWINLELVVISDPVPPSLPLYLAQERWHSTHSWVSFHISMWLVLFLMYTHKHTKDY